jgi:hypothetical protein
MSSLLLSALPAPFDWLTWGLLAGPLGLVLVGAGATALCFLGGEPEVEL